MAFGDGVLDRCDGAFLVATQKAQLVLADEVVAFAVPVPARFRRVVRPLRQRDVVAADRFGDQPLRVGLESVVTLERFRRRVARDQVRVALFEIPEVMQVAVGEDDEAAFLGFGVLPRLFLADQRVFVLRLGFEHEQRFAAGVEQQEVGEAVAGFLEVFAEFVNLGLAQLDVGFERDVGFAVRTVEEAPAGFFEQLVDLDAGFGFLGGHFGVPWAVFGWLRHY